MHYELGLPPWRAGWLHRVAPGGAGVWASSLRTLFSDPEMVALISATPRMARILRQPCFMLGLETSVLKPPPAPSAAVASTDDDAITRAPAITVALERGSIAPCKPAETVAQSSAEMVPAIFAAV